MQRNYIFTEANIDQIELISSSATCRKPENSDYFAQGAENWLAIILLNRPNIELPDQTDPDGISNARILNREAYVLTQRQTLASHLCG